MAHLNFESLLHTLNVKICNSCFLTNLRIQLLSLTHPLLLFYIVLAKVIASDYCCLLQTGEGHYGTSQFRLTTATCIEC